MRTSRSFLYATFALFLALLPGHLLGDEADPAGVARQVDQHYNSLHSLQVHFVQEFDGLGQHRKETGTLLLKKPGRMRWSYDQPPGKLFVADGHNAYFYTPGHNEVQRVPAKKLEDLQSPLRFLLGHSDLSHELTGMQITRVGQNYRISGVPRHLAQRAAALRFLVAADGTILQIEINEVDDSRSTFNFDGEVADVPANDSEFLFRPPPGTAIIDGPPPS